MVRFKNRWLLVEFLPCHKAVESHSANTRQIWADLRESVLRHFGDAGWGAVGASLNVKYYSPTTNICIIRVARDHFRIAWAAVTLLTSLDGQQCIPRVVHCSGTIKHAQLAAIRYDRELIGRMREQGLSTLPSGSMDDYLTSAATEIEALQD